MAREYNLKDHDMERFDLLGHARMRRKLWRIVSYCLTIYLPEFLLLRHTKHAEGFRSKIAFLTLMVLVNAIFMYVLVFHHSRVVVSIVATAIFALIVYLRFILSLFCKRKIENCVPEDCGPLALMLPCYTEGEAVIRSTIDSIVEAADEIPSQVRKCLFIVCDGLVRGRNNAKLTSEIVSDILGKAQRLDLGIAYTSPWTGPNACDIESGMYKGMPYIKLTKHANRGKRDSQLLLMAFLRKEDNPLTSCMYKHLDMLIASSNNLFPFQYLFVTDSDTLIERNAIKILLEGLTKHDRTIAVCGNVKVKNPHQSLLTLAQVYEYFFAQYFFRAAESSMGQVTCLPGAFSLYKLYHIDSTGTLLPDVLCDNIYFSFGFNEANTLHRMNLILGEDRFLTSLVWKFMPHRQVFFIPAAECKTGVPETPRVLLSQRRRWDNSGFHNVLDLMFIPGHPVIRLLYCLQVLSTVLVPAMIAVAGTVVAQLVQSIMHLDFSIMQYVCYGTVVLGLFGSPLVKAQPYVLLYLPVYLICLPFFVVVIPLYCMWTMDNVRWGKTQPTFSDREATNVKEAAKVIADNNNQDVLISSVTCTNDFGFDKKPLLAP